MKKHNVYRITKFESNAILITKTLLVFFVAYIHANKSEIHFAEYNLVYNIPYWFSTLKYIISNNICRVAVPLYFTVSSVLLYRRVFIWRENTTKKIKRLLIPYCIVNVSWIIIFFIFQNIKYTSVFFASPQFIINNWDLFNWIDSIVGYTGYPMAYHLWFLRDLFVLNLLSIIIMYILNISPKSIILVTIIFWLSGCKSHIFCLSREAIVFWIIGCYIVKYDIRLEKLLKYFRYIFSLYIVFIIADVSLRNNYEIGTIVHNLCILIGCVCVYISFYKLSYNNHLISFISKFSQYSFGVYLLHEYILKFTLKIATVIFPTTIFFIVLEYLLLPIIVLMVCLVICIIFNKILPRAYSIFTGKL